MTCNFVTPATAAGAAHFITEIVGLAIAEYALQQVISLVGDAPAAQLAQL